MRGNDEGSTTSPGDRPSVLVVAGDPQDVEGLTRVLEPAGYRVDTAGGAAEGVARLRRAGFDLMVWDATLPENKDLTRGRRLVLDHRPASSTPRRAGRRRPTIRRCGG
ncbi:hypothetical protein OG250_45665 [Streptomyces sp. NBC_00487]|uniref:hypothetical protein n=1 Tax=unclassified Streptomyces TaxID=2593676 RepID=UPI002E1957F4|nr:MULTISPECIES: hypothetical protein [unclassified Streptomyces]